MPSAPLQKLPGCKGVEEYAFQTLSFGMLNIDLATSEEKEEGWKVATTEMPDKFIINKSSSGEGEAFPFFPLAPKSLWAEGRKPAGFTFQARHNIKCLIGKWSQTSNRYSITHRSIREMRSICRRLRGIFSLALLFNNKNKGSSPAVLFGKRKQRSCQSSISCSMHFSVHEWKRTSYDWEESQLHHCPIIQ